MNDQDLTAVEILTRHLAALTADLERVLQEHVVGRYGPATIQDAIAETVAHIATLTQGAFVPTEVKCDRCQDIQWVCEEHTTKPWAGIIGDDKGCAPDCPGPGMPCPDCIKEGRWGNADEVVWDTTVALSDSYIPLHCLKHHDREALANIPAGTRVRVTVTVIDEAR